MWGGLVCFLPGWCCFLELCLQLPFKKVSNNIIYTNEDISTINCCRKGTNCCKFTRMQEMKSQPPSIVPALPSVASFVRLSLPGKFPRLSNSMSKFITQAFCYKCVVSEPKPTPTFESFLQSYGRNYTQLYSPAE